MEDQKTTKYGVELVLDMSHCDTSTFTKGSIEKYLVEICELVHMKRQGDPVFWIDTSHHPHLKGVSAIQFIETSNIVIHTLDILKAVFVNIFSCKDFDTGLAEEFTKKYFGAGSVQLRVLERKYSSKDAV